MFCRWRPPRSFVLIGALMRWSAGPLPSRKPVAENAISDHFSRPGDLRYPLEKRRHRGGDCPAGHPLQRGRYKTSDRASGQRTEGLRPEPLARLTPPSPSPARLHHREDASPHRWRERSPCLDHRREGRVGGGRGYILGYTAAGSRVILGRNGLCRRIANPPSSVRLRPEPLARRPSRSPGNTGAFRGFLRFLASLATCSAPRLIRW